MISTDSVKKSLMTNQTNCLIIGGGICGLVAGTQLQAKGFSVKVLDKGRGIGGRFATRRIPHPQQGEGIFDYGVQYLTVNTEGFQEWIREWLQRGIIETWTGVAKESKPVKYKGVKGIRSIAKHLASYLDVETKTKVVHLSEEKGVWTVVTEQGRNYYSDRVILTAPVPQSLQLLQESNIQITDEKLSLVSYHSCLTGLLLVSETIAIGDAGGYYVGGEVLDWIACNYQKGISPDAYAVTLQGNTKFSAEYSQKRDRELALEQLIEAAWSYLGQGSVIDVRVHFWRYSTPIHQFPASFFAISDSLYLAGDGFLATASPVSPVESAVLSGLAAARAINN